MLLHLRLLALLAALSLPAPVATRPVGPPTLDGSVIDLVRGIALEDATVTLVRSGRQVTTDRAGRFSFESTPVTANDTLVVTHPDFVPVRIPLGSPPDDGWTLRIQLLQSPVGVAREPDSAEADR